MGGYLIAFVSFTIYVLPNSAEEYCMLEYFNPQCQQDEVIIMQEAVYGRMKEGKCIDNDRELGCQADVLDEMDNHCSGKDTCNILIGSNDIGSKSSCWKDLSQYLDASYLCRKAFQTSMCNSMTPIELLQINTIITSDILLQDHSCISQNEPFTLSAKPGQTLNITLIDFQSNHNQITYGKLKDIKSGNEIPLRGDKRLSHLMISSGSQVEITFYQSSMRFAIELSVTGCADLSPPEGAWMTRDGDITELGCHSGKRTWRLQCVNDRWVGAVGYCGTVSDEKIVIEKGVEPIKANISTNIIVFGICSCVLFLSSVVFLLGVLILRRHNTSKRTMYGYYPAVPVKDLMTFDKNSLNMHSSMITSLPMDSDRMVNSQNYKSLQM